MCDDVTEAENAAHLERLKLNRRELSVGAGAALATMLVGCDSRSTPARTAPSGGSPYTSSDSASPGSAPSVSPSGLVTTSGMVTIEMPDGTAEAFFVTPEEGAHPGVLMWPDIAGLRQAFMTMAMRLAGEGYAVLVVNHYYRSSNLPILETFTEWQTPEGKAKIGPMKEALTPERITSDGAAYVAWLDTQAGVDKGKMFGSAGYCMTGSYTFRTAVASPARVGAVASFHGGGLVTQDSTSPHLLFPQMKASSLICIAQSDDTKEPETKNALRTAADAARVPAEIEVYPAQHGWCVVDSPVYDEVQAERAWARMLALFGQAL